MLSIEYETSVPMYKQEEIGGDTFVRAYRGKLQVNIANDGTTTLRNLKVKPVVESYIGQDRPILFSTIDLQVVKEIPSKEMISLIFDIWPSYPGLIAVAIYIKDTNNNDMMAKRNYAKTYKKSPVRWWFHVIDDIQMDTLKALETLIKQKISKPQR